MGAAAAGHLRIEGAQVVELVLDGAQPRVAVIDGGLETVGELGAPGGDVLEDDVATALGGFSTVTPAYASAVEMLTSGFTMASQ